MTRLRLERAEPLRRELESFVAAVRGEGNNIVAREDGLKAVAITQHIVTAGLTGQVITGRGKHSTAHDRYRK